MIKRRKSFPKISVGRTAMFVSGLLFLIVLFLGNTAVFLPDEDKFYDLLAELPDEPAGVVRALGAANGPVYEGKTTASYTGDLKGFSGADIKCQSEYPGSHMCSQSEMINSGGTGFGGTGWARCEGFLLGNSQCGTVSKNLTGANMGCTSYNVELSTDYGITINASGTPGTATCNSALPIHCCSY